MLAADYEKGREFAPSPDQLAAYAGDYHSNELAVVYRLRVLDGQLRLAQIADTQGIPRTGMASLDPLRATIEDEFEITNQGMILHFEKGRQGSTGFELGAGGTRLITFSRIPQLSTPLHF